MASQTFKTVNKKKRMKKAHLRPRTANAVKAIVKAAIAPIMEKKHFDTAFTSYGMDNSFSQFTDLSMIPQGVLDTQRIGDTVYIESIQFKFIVQSPDNWNYSRIQLIQWHEDTAFSNPSMAITLQSATTIPRDLVSPLQIDKNQKFTILYDKLFGQVAAAETQDISISLYKDKGFKRKLEFTNSSTTGMGHFFLLVSSNSNVVPNPTLDGWVRIRYRDA